jgi:hypothetical protein
MARRRTRALLPFATVTGSAPIFDPDWSAIEAAYGHGLNDDERRVFAGRVNHYLDMERFEEEARPLADVVRWAKAVDRETRALQKSLAAAHGNDDRERLLDAVKIAAQPGHFYHDAVERLQGLLLWFARHVRIEIAEFEKHSAGTGFKDGAAWDEMIVALTALLGKRGLPTGAAKDDLEPSPFVRLIDALQEQLGGRGRYQHSMGGLASAISETRAGAKSRRHKK